MVWGESWRHACSIDTSHHVNNRQCVIAHVIHIATTLRDDRPKPLRPGAVHDWDYQTMIAELTARVGPLNPTGKHPCAMRRRRR